MAKPDFTLSTNLPNVAIDFDVEAFDELLRSHGVQFTHHRGMRCPVGMIDPFDSRRPHEDHSGCSGGIIYTVAGKVTCSFGGNSMGTVQNEVGLLDQASVQATSPRFYDDKPQESVLFFPLDRLYLANEELVVPNWQLFEHSLDGRDRLNFPVAQVQDLMDSAGNRYQQGQDFDVVNGALVWKGRRPDADSNTGRGLVCSIRYLYRPFWYVKTIPHELRVSQVQNPVTGDRELQRMPQMVVLQREYVYEKEERDEQAKDPDSSRQAPLPTDARFGR